MRAEDIESVGSVKSDAEICFRLNTETFLVDLWIRNGLPPSRSSVVSLKSDQVEEFIRMLYNMKNRLNTKMFKGGFEKHEEMGI